MNAAKGQQAKDGGYAGHWVEANTWFRLGFSRVEARALKALAGNIEGSKAQRTSARAAWMVLRTALAHYDVIERLVQADGRYVELEGLSLGKFHEAQIVRLLLASKRHVWYWRATTTRIRGPFQMNAPSYCRMRTTLPIGNPASHWRQRVRGSWNSWRSTRPLRYKPIPCP